jgi:hypothetical protein
VDHGVFGSKEILEEFRDDSLDVYDARRLQAPGWADQSYAIKIAAQVFVCEPTQ